MCVLGTNVGPLRKRLLLPTELSPQPVLAFILPLQNLCYSAGQMTHCLFLQINLVRTQPCSFVYVLAMGCFHTEQWLTSHNKDCISPKA